MIRGRVKWSTLKDMQRICHKLRFAKVDSNITMWDCSASEFSFHNDTVLDPFALDIFIYLSDY